MKLRFKSATDHPDDLSDTQHIRILWQQAGAGYVKALQEVTGLRFRQHIAVVRCGKLPVSKAGHTYKEAIWLATHQTVARGRFQPARRSDDDLLTTLTHELCHRLLAQNDVLLSASTEPGQFVYKDHRLLYIFLYDSWVAAFGKKHARKLAKFEGGIKVPAYHRAWAWAMRFSAKKRAHLTAKLLHQHHARLSKEGMQIEHLQPLEGGGPGPSPQETAQMIPSPEQPSPEAHPQDIGIEIKLRNLADLPEADTPPELSPESQYWSRRIMRDDEPYGPNYRHLPVAGIGIRNEGDQAVCTVPTPERLNTIVDEHNPGGMKFEKVDGFVPPAEFLTEKIGRGVFPLSRDTSQNSFQYDDYAQYLKEQGLPIPAHGHGGKPQDCLE